MSIIQTIREKYARFAVIAIALALIGFILIDYISGRGSSLFSSGNSTTLGRINGKTIDQNDFEKKVLAQERSMEQQRGTSIGEAERQQIIEELWKQEVDETLLKDEFNKLGLSIGKKERTDMLMGSEPQQLARQYLGDPQTGEYDPTRAQQIINSIKRGKDKAQKDNLNLLLDAIDNARLGEKYVSLVAGTVHYPKWLLEKQNADNSLMAKISYVSVPLSQVPDNEKEVAVSDKEIADYIDKRKDIYKSDDETRSIEYVLFSAAPSSADSSAALKKIELLKEKFPSTNDSAELRTLLANESDLAFSDKYFPKSAIQIPVKDSIFKLEKNAVYGPYLDGSDYVLAKLLDTKTLPDSVYCRHILMRIGEGGLPDSIAEKRIDSVIAAINQGASFVALMKQVSMDQAANSQDSAGIMKFSSQQIQEADRFDQDFGKYILFEGTKGQRKKVKTKFGYHYIEIVDQKNPEPHYKIAYLAKKIETSDETERNAENSALRFAGDSRDLKSFEANFEKTLKPKGYQKLFASDISSHAYEIQGIGVSRTFIRDNIFKADRGDVLQPQRVGDNYVVAVVTEINKPGTISVAVGRRYIEPLLRNQKKAEVLKKRIGNITTLDAVSAAMKQPVQTADSIRFDGRGNNSISYEQKVVGATFNPANNGKIVKEALTGRGGVYVIQVDNVTATVVENADVNAQRRNIEMQGRMGIMMNNPYGYGQQYDPALVLRKAAKIKDNRSKFY
ncbi:MAG TPA: peptidylprolyl isomerase [Chitinophagaceae bacterium]|jgi:peptidyl-prolyl cis-trans isomerase D|nr:peptidylprolyl isomerase [Chitinophagaceae bacterium]